MMFDAGIEEQLIRLQIQSAEPVIENGLVEKLMDDIHKGTTFYGGSVGDKFHYLLRYAFVEENPLLIEGAPNRIARTDHYKDIAPEQGNRTYSSPYHRQYFIIACEIYDHDVDMNYPIIINLMKSTQISDAYGNDYVYCRYYDGTETKYTNDYNTFGSSYPVFYPVTVYTKCNKIISQITSHSFDGGDASNSPTIRFSGSFQLWMIKTINQYFHYEDDPYNIRLGYYKEISSEEVQIFNTSSFSANFSYKYNYLTKLNQKECWKKITKLANAIQFETNQPKINYIYDINTKPNI